MKKGRLWSKKNQTALAIFAAVFFFGLVFAAIVPAGSLAPDEGQQVQIVNFLAREKKPPVFNVERDLYFVTWLDSGAYYLMTYNPPLSYLPYLLANISGSKNDQKNDLLPMRIISSFFMALFAAFLFLALCNFSPKELLPAAAVTIFISFIPQVIYSAAYVNLEPFALFVCAVIFYLFGRIFLFEKDDFWSYLLLGISFAALALCKVNYLASAVFFTVLTLVFIIRDKEEWRQKIKNILTIILPVLAIAGWWWVRNFRLYRDPIIINYISKQIIARAPAWFSPPAANGYNLITIIFRPDFARFAFLGFFAGLGSVDIFLPSFFYLLFLLILIFLICKIFVDRKEKQRSEIFLTLFFLIFLIVDFLIFARKNLIDFSPQGRHLFPMLVPLAWVLFLGARKIRNHLVLLVIAAFSLFSAIWALAVVYQKYRIEGLVSFHQNLRAFQFWPCVVYFILFAAAIAFVIINIANKSKTQNPNVK